MEIVVLLPNDKAGVTKAGSNHRAPLGDIKMRKLSACELVIVSVVTLSFFVAITVDN
jgi:hypothetical protein